MHLHDVANAFFTRLSFLQYLDNVFAMAGPNMRINGRNYEEYDNFDYGTFLFTRFREQNH
jgi:hypothetical protein